jgi:hypothetical protein
MLFTGFSFLKLCAGVCVSASLVLSSCDEEYEKATDAIQKAHQAKVANCVNHSDPQGCVDRAIDSTNAAHTAFQQAWATAVAKNYESEEEFKRGLIEEIMKIADPVIKALLLKIVEEVVGPKNMEVSLLGQATIVDLPVLTDAVTLMGSTTEMEAAGLVHGDGRDSDVVSNPSNPIEPIRLINKVMNVSVDADFELAGVTQSGTLTGPIIVQVGEAQIGPRQIRVVSGTLTLDSAYSGMNGSPILMTVKKGGRSSMTVLADGKTILRLDLDASTHSLSFAHDQKPFLEIPMIETAADTFQIAVASVPFDYIHVWQPWPVSDFNNDGQYDPADIGAFSQALATLDFTTDLDMNGLYNTYDLDLYLGYFAEDSARWQFQSDRFNND